MTRPRSIRAWWMPAGWRVLAFDQPSRIDAHLVADLMARANRGEIRRIALASGRTFGGFFAALRRAVDEGQARFDEIDFHHLDEFEGIEPASAGSLAREIGTALFPDGSPARGRFNPVDARSGDAAASQHETRLSGCDFVLLGIGRNGHLAFNEPGTPLGSRSHFATLADATRGAHEAAFEGRPVPARALTAGLRTIASARELVLVATGRAKAEAVRAAILGPIGPASPASALRLHDRVTVLLDEEAAAGLSEPPEPPVTVPAIEVRDRESFRPTGAALVVAPHPDDASISCGGLMTMLDAGAMRHIVTFSTGARAIPGDPAEARRIRERESEDEADVQGASVSFLRARSYDSGVFEPEDAAGLLEVLERCHPRLVLLPAREDPHPTHRLCRLTAEEAIRAYWERHRRQLEIWTCEGPWFLLERTAVNLLLRLDRHAHDRKQAGIRAHRSQVDRVPFDSGADALERLRAIAFSESHLGGAAGGLAQDARIECYRRIILG